MIVFKLGLAKSIHHARVLIKQRHIRVRKQVRLTTVLTEIVPWILQLWLVDIQTISDEWEMKMKPTCGVQNSFCMKIQWALISKTDQIGILTETLESYNFGKVFFRLSMSHHTLSDLTPKSTLTSHSDHHSVAVVQDVSRERTPKRARAAAETNPTKRRPIITVLILNKKIRTG